MGGRLERGRNYARRGQDVLAELLTHASRALAAEQLVAESLQDAGSDRVKRRLEVLRKRWEREFARRANEVNARRAAVTARSMSSGPPAATLA